MNVWLHRQWVFGAGAAAVCNPVRPDHGLGPNVFGLGAVLRWQPRITEGWVQRILGLKVEYCTSNVIWRVGVGLSREFAQWPPAGAAPVYRGYAGGMICADVQFAVIPAGMGSVSMQSFPAFYPADIPVAAVPELYDTVLHTAAGAPELLSYALLVEIA